MSSNGIRENNTRHHEVNQLLAERDQPIIAVPITEQGRAMVRYEVDSQRDEPNDGQHLPESVQQALSLAGAWSDLDWDETVEALDRIRHESRPTPPIEPDEA
jgi:hypothetical protein